MSRLHELAEAIDARTARIGVIGLGYVGLPVACLFAERGFQVLGVELRGDRVKRINNGDSPIEWQEPGLPEVLGSVVASGRLRATTSYADLGACDVVLLNVETPVADDRLPRYEALISACSSLARVMKPGVLVIVESTVSPGTVEGIVRRTLEEQSGLALGEGLFLGHCPERVMPGKLLSNLKTMARVIGGSTPEVAETMRVLYKQIVDGHMDTCDCTTAEIVKTAENAYRDVNIAFANELALICEQAGADFWQVRQLVNKSPGRNVLLAGPGVGGHCIPKDPWLLAASTEHDGLRLIPAARMVNDSMPTHAVDVLACALERRGRSLEGSRVLVLGLTYLEDSGDTRSSPSAALLAALRARGAQPIEHDPYVPGREGDPELLADGADGVVCMVGHREYLGLNLERLVGALRTPIVLDARHVLDGQAVQAAGGDYLAIGVAAPWS